MTLMYMYTDMYGSERVTYKSMNESKTTKSPGLISSFKEPVADDAIM